MTDIAVIGDGWSALGVVGYLAHSGKSVHWIAGTGSRIQPVLPTLDAAHGSAGAAAWRDLAGKLGIETGEFQTGSYLREFRNKAFREPAWTKAPTPELRE